MLASTLTQCVSNPWALEVLNLLLYQHPCCWHLVSLHDLYWLFLYCEVPLQQAPGSYRHLVQDPPKMRERGSEEGLEDGLGASFGRFKDPSYRHLTQDILGASCAHLIGPCKKTAVPPAVPLPVPPHCIYPVVLSPAVLS